MSESLTKFQQFMIVMVKLRLNAGHQDLAYRACTVQILTMLTSTVAGPATARRHLPPVLQLQMSTVQSLQPPPAWTVGSCDNM